MPQNDSENVDKYKVFVVLMHISGLFPRVFVITSFTVKRKKKFNISFLCNLYVLFESFWSPNMGKRLTMVELKIQ